MMGNLKLKILKSMLCSKSRYNALLYILLKHKVIINNNNNKIYLNY